MGRIHGFVIALLWNSTVHAAHPVEGVWILQGIDSEQAAVLTTRGTAIQQAYDLLNDDPSLRCEAASLARVYGNPNTRTGIRLVDGMETHLGTETGFERLSVRGRYYNDALMSQLAMVRTVSASCTYALMELPLFKHSMSATICRQLP